MSVISVTRGQHFDSETGSPSQCAPPCWNQFLVQLPTAAASRTIHRQPPVQGYWSTVRNGNTLPPNKPPHRPHGGSHSRTSATRGRYFRPHAHHEYFSKRW